MRFHNALDEVLGNGIRVRVLRNLLSSRSQGLTGRELSRRSKASASRTIEALAILERTGLVHRETAGPSHVWRLAREHVLIGPLDRLFQSESEIPDQLHEDLRLAIRGLPVRQARLFGSVARGDEEASSDIDLFVEVSAPNQIGNVRESLAALSATFARRFGNSLSSLVLTREQVRRPTNPRLLKAIQKEGLPVGP